MSHSPYKMSYPSALESVRSLFMVYEADDTLSSYVRRIIQEKGLNLREVSERARKAGYQISHATVGDIINNPSRRFGVKTLVALAHGIGSPEREVLDYASGRRPQEPSEYEKRLCEQLYERMRSSSPGTQEYLKRAIRSLLKESEEDSLAGA